MRVYLVVAGSKPFSLVMEKVGSDPVSAIVSEVFWIACLFQDDY
jgi:hypothetical protein